MDAVRGFNHTTRGKFTRPADGNVYAPGDVIADSTTVPTILTIAGMTKDDLGCGIIQGVVCTSSANGTPKPDLEMWIFDTAPAVANDNAPFAVTNADLLNIVTVIPIPAGSFKVGLSGAGASGNVVCEVNNLGIPFTTLVATPNTLFAQVVVRNAYTPITGEVFQFRLKILD